jgi:hypothetical protein
MGSPSVSCKRDATTSQLSWKFLCLGRIRDIPAMASNDLVALAAAVRNALASPTITATTDEAGKRARKELLNTLPDLQRALEGPKQTLINTTWSVCEQ